MGGTRDWEREIRVQFPTEKSFSEAYNDALTNIGKTISRITVKRPTIFLDTEDQKILSNGGSISIVLHSGLTGPQHKLVLKENTTKPYLRRESVFPIQNPDEKAIQHILSNQELEDFVQSSNVKTKDLVPILLLRQNRKKRTLLIYDDPVFLSFDKVDFCDPYSRQLLNTLYYVEIESSEKDLQKMLGVNCLLEIAKYFEDHHYGLITHETKLIKGLKFIDLAGGKEQRKHITSSNQNQKYRVISFNTVMSSFPRNKREECCRRKSITLSQCYSLSSGSRTLTSNILTSHDQEISKKLIPLSFNICKSLLPYFQSLQKSRSEKIKEAEYHLSDVQFEDGISDTLISYIQSLDVVKLSLANIYKNKETITTILDGTDIDALPYPDKSMGSYSTFTQNCDPTIHMTWQSTLNSAADLVHEFGHIVHYKECRTFSECSSILKETMAMLMERIGIKYLPNASSTFYRLERWRSLYFRPIYQTEFEMKWIKENNIEILNELYQKILENFYGPNLTVRGCDKNEWMKIGKSLGKFSRLPYAIAFLISTLVYNKMPVITHNLFKIGTLDELSRLIDTDLTDISSYKNIMDDYKKLVLDYEIENNKK